MADMYVASQSKVAPAGQAQRGPKSMFPNRVKVRGKVRLAGRAVFFDPDEWSRPVMMFKFKEVTKLEEYNLELISEDEAALAANSSSQTFDRAGSPNAACNFLVFRCAIVSTQLAGGEPTVFGVEHHTAPHVLSFPFGSAGAFVEQMNSLLSVERVADGLRRTQIVQRMVDIQQKQTPFSLSDLKDPDERVLSQPSCSRILPLVTQKGRLVVTSAHVYFQPTFPVVTPGIDIISLRDVRRVERRRVNFLDTGMEVATFNDAVYLFSFSKPQQRDEVFHALGSHPVLDRLSVNDVSAMMRKWVDGRISTFDYLMFLNWSAGRSLNDLAQYPVLPWVITDYSSQVLKLDDSRSFRDLTKPVGALTEARLAGFRKRADDLRSIGETAYLYGSHYSNPAYVTFFKVRTHPEYMLVLHSGKLDQSSRIFESIPETFASVLSGPTDLKELIPEFYFGEGDFLKRCRIDLGTKGDGVKVRREVLLPPWADDSPEVFVKQNRMALESEIASKGINHWIDLIFGFKQQGDEAWKADNVFHPHCYETGMKNIHLLEETRRAAVEMHVKEFGQVPKQLFTTPHPSRQCGATPLDHISMANFMPPDSDELAAPIISNESVETIRERSSQRVTEFVAASSSPPSATVVGEDDGSDGDSRPSSSRADEKHIQRGVVSRTTRSNPPSKDVRSEQEIQSKEPSPVLRRHVDVVNDALDLSHVLEPGEDNSDSHSQGTHAASGTGNKTAESADSKGQLVGKIGPQFTIRAST